MLRRGAGLLAVGSAAGAGAFAVRSGSGASDGGSADDAESAADVLVAGSLQRVAGRVGRASVEAHGSVACRRLLADGLRDPDAVALADPGLFAGLADRATCFATNALVVAVAPDGAAAEYASGDGGDWRALLADEDLALGRTDPERDPLGYRTVMALRLAEGVDAEAVLARTSVFPETGLLRTLEAGGVDAAFAYRNMAVAHDLPSLDLPDAVDFSDPDRADEYARASVELADRTVTGAPIRYAARGRTDRGREWVRRLASARETLTAAGFGVPESYPVEREIPSG